MIRAFIRLNRRLSIALAQYLPNARAHTYRAYPGAVAERLAESGVHWVADIGGGKSCRYAGLRPPGWQGRIVAVDIAPEELRHNREADARLVLDATRAYPFRDGAIDLITSQSVIEHLANLDDFLAESARVLRSGGYSIHWIPCKFAPFALINALLPNAVARRVLFFLDETKIGICGFPVVYDRCHPAAIRRAFAQHGFEIVELRPSYYQSSYFAFFFPLFLISSAYEILLQSLHIETLCAHALVVARKRPLPQP